MGEASQNGVSKYERTPFGKEMLKHFLFDPKFKNLNHGTIDSSSSEIYEAHLILKVLLVQFPELSRRREYNIKKQVKPDQIHSSAMSFQALSMRIELQLLRF